jgi:Exocyst complex component Sec6
MTARDHVAVPDPVVVAAVSDALSASLASGADLLTAVDDIAPKWAAELAGARDIARRQQETVLAHRAALHKSLDHGVSLTNAFTTTTRTKLTSLPTTSSALPTSSIPALAASRVSSAALSHTLHLYNFLAAAPALIADAVTMLDRVSDAIPASPGIASDLFHAHENIVACERVRDMSLLDALPNLSHAAHVADIFTGTESARDQLEHYLMANIFSAVPRYAHSDPRVLVAAVRVVQRECQEDAWWRRHLSQAALTPAAGVLVRSFGSRDYDRRMRDAIIVSIDHLFRAPPFLFDIDPDADVPQSLAVSSTPLATQSPSASLPPPASPSPSPSPSPPSSSSSTNNRDVSVVHRMLAWIDKLLATEQDMRRFIVPCFPASYNIGRLFTTEYHRSIMTVVGDLFHATDIRNDVGDADLINIVKWYGKYRNSPSGATATGGLDIPTEQAERLVSAVARHCRARLLARVLQIVTTDPSAVMRIKPSRRASTTAASISRHESSSGSNNSDGPRGSSREQKFAGGYRGKGGEGSSSIDDVGLCTTSAPELVFSAVGNLVDDVRVLGLPAANSAVAHAATSVLRAFQDKIQSLLVCNFAGDDVSLCESRYRPLSQTNDEYVCALANNSARCLDYSEGLRDSVLLLVDSTNRASVEEEFEAVIDEFRSNASAAIADLVNGVTIDIAPLTRRQFAPRTGTEVMLDVIEVLDEFFTRYKSCLIPYHFEQLALGCLKHLVSQYVQPFLDLSASAHFMKGPGQVSRRYAGKVGTRGQDDETGKPGEPDDKEEIDDDDLFCPAGLSTMAAEAVIAQMDKDLVHLSAFFAAHVTVYEVRQLKLVISPLHDIRALLTCEPTSQALADSHFDASASIARFCCSGELTLQVSEVMWALRSDVKPATLLEAAARVRSQRGNSSASGRNGADITLSAASTLSWNGRHLFVP